MNLSGPEPYCSPIVRFPTPPRPFPCLSYSLRGHLLLLPSPTILSRHSFPSNRLYSLPSPLLLHGLMPSPHPSLTLRIPPRSRQVFKHATEFFSCDTPSLATVILAMDYIDNMLTNQARDKELDEAVRAAVGMAKKILSKYYKLSDLSATYRIAMSTYLNPRCILMMLIFASSQFFILNTSYATSRTLVGRRPGLQTPARCLKTVICAEVVKPPDRGEVRWTMAEINEGNRTPMRANSFQSPPMVLGGWWWIPPTVGGPHCTSMAAGAVH